MSFKNEICFFDYLIGTLSTAYKGSLKSLICKDFCIKADDNRVVFSGKIISLPEGKTEACLIEAGNEIERVEILDGAFELFTTKEIFETAPSLQIDIVQQGRHIGTFLLKRESHHGNFISAVELSRDLEGINLRRLNESVQDKPGLREKSEKIISNIASTKRDWASLSEEIALFMHDLFWHSKSAFDLWLEIALRIMIRAAEFTGKTEKGKLLRNLISIAEWILEKEGDKENKKRWLSIWTEGIVSSAIEPGGYSRYLLKLAPSLKGLVSDALIKKFNQFTFNAIKEYLNSYPVIDKEVLDQVNASLTLKDSDLFMLFSKEYKEQNLFILENSLLYGVETEDKLYRSISPYLEGIPLKIILETLIKALKTDNLNAADLIFEEFFKLLKESDKEDIELVKGELKRLFSLISERGLIEFFGKIITGLNILDAEIRSEILLSEYLFETIKQSGNQTLVERYIKEITSVIIPPPHFTGISSDTWAPEFNKNHPLMLSKYMRILANSTHHHKPVLLHVISNLTITGTFIPDEMLFQREVSRFLNSPAPKAEYLLSYILLKRLPVFFNEIGASGRLRDLSTEIDSWGDDPLLYFLRKQIHVNASRENINLTKAILLCWITGNIEPVSGFLPDEIRNSIDNSLVSRYRDVARKILSHLGVLSGNMELDFKRLSLLDLESQPVDIKTDEEKKLFLLIRIYQELLNKYNPYAFKGIHPASFDKEIPRVVNRLRRLKETILSPVETRPEESLYFKRHIAFGIPSVIGSYHEAKFDAFKEIIREENWLRLITEDFIQSGEKNPSLSFDTTISIIDALLNLLEITGLPNIKMREYSTVLRFNHLEKDQIADVIRMIQHELTWHVEVLYREFHPHLKEVISLMPEEQIPKHLLRISPERDGRERKIADILIRDIISTVTGLDELDRLLNSALLWIESGKISTFSSTSVADQSDRYIYFFDRTNPDEAVRNAPQLGSKALNLILLKIKGLLVPEGFVLSSALTEKADTFFSSKEGIKILEEGLSYLEEKTGLRLGDGTRPLFLSVRSGSYISMPGILSSILYVGINDKTIEGFSKKTGSRWLALDSYRRFIEHYASVVLNIPEELIENEKKEFLSHTGIDDLSMTSEDMLYDLIDRLMGIIEREDKSIPADPFEQLIESVKAIYLSWQSPRAAGYRRAMGISHRWGTAVTVMQMIQGNAKTGGASVFFTRRPFTLEKGIYGEIRESATGDDIVYGRINNRPISKDASRKQTESLEETDPELFSYYEKIAKEVENSFGGLPQEVESAYVRVGDKPVIYILQSKRMEFSKGYSDRFHDICRMESNIVGRGIGVHGGALSGVVVLSSSPEIIKELKDKSGLPAILLRPETNTDDSTLMPLIEGLITSRGGATSHAAILAQKFDITAVVGCTDLVFHYDEEKPYITIGGERFYEGDQISLDGATGIIYSGVCSITEKRDAFEV